MRVCKGRRDIIVPVDQVFEVMYGNLVRPSGPVAREKNRVLDGLLNNVRGEGRTPNYQADTL